MINYYLIIFILALSLKSTNCSWIPDPFCITIEDFPEDVIVYGTVTSRNEQSVDLTIIDVLRGEETREVIRIWDGTDFDCNGIHSMSTETLGRQGDTIVIMLPKIVEIENEWDVQGDYRRPHPYGYRPELGVKDGIVVGSILEWGYGFQEVPYDELKEKFLTSSFNCDLILSANPEVEQVDVIEVVNPFVNNLSLVLSKPFNKGSIALFSSNGALVYQEALNNRLKLNLETSRLNPGLYILEINVENKPYKRMKLIKL